MKKNLDMLRSLHALDVAHEVLDVLEHTPEKVSSVQEMALVILTEIMYNTAIIADHSDNSNERRKNDNQRDKQDDCRSS